MQEQYLSPIQIRVIFYTLKKHKWKVLTLFFATVITVTIGSLLATPIYQASAQLLVKPGREDIYVSPIQGSPAIVNDSWQGEKVKAEIAILKSSGLIRELVSQVGAENLYDYPTLMGRLLRTKSRPGIPPMEKVYKAVMRSLEVSSGSNSYVITITFYWPDPLIAANVVNQLLDLYFVQHLKVHTNSKTYDLLERQSKEWETTLQESEGQLEDFKQRHAITSLSEQKTILLESLSEVEARRRQTESEINETNAMIVALRGKLSRLDKNVQLQETHNTSSDTLAALKTRLVELELQGLREEIKRVKKMIEEEEKKKVVVSGRSPIRHGLESDLLNAEARLEGLQAKEKNLEQQIADYQQELQDLDSLEKQLHELERKAEINEANYKLYLSKFQEARISESMDKENIANVGIIESAVPLMKPVKPKKRLNVLLGAFLGLIAGVGIVFLLEFLNPVFHTREDVQQFLNLPVLATIPKEQKLQKKSDEQPPTAKRKLKRLLSKYLKLAA